MTNQEPAPWSFTPVLGHGVIAFAHKLEEVVIAAVEGGHMTKDLAILISPDQPWETSEQYLATLARHLNRALD